MYFFSFRFICTPSPGGSQQVLQLLVGFPAVGRQKCKIYRCPSRICLFNPPQPRGLSLPPRFYAFLLFCEFFIRKVFLTPFFFSKNHAATS